MNDDTNSSGVLEASHGDFTESAVFELLGNERRRECISQLLQTDREDGISIRALSETVAAALCDDDSPSRRFQQSVYVSLTQTHLPQLDEYHVVNYDEAEKIVSTGENSDLIEELIRLSANEPRRGRLGDGDVAENGERSRATAETTEPADDESATFRLAERFGDGRSSLSRPVQVFASVAVVVVMVLAVGGPVVVPDAVRVLLALLHVLTLGTLLGIVSP